MEKNPYIHNKQKKIKFEKYIANITKPWNYFGELETYPTSKIFNIFIYIHKYQKPDQKYIYIVLLMKLIIYHTILF